MYSYWFLLGPKTQAKQYEIEESSNAANAPKVIHVAGPKLPVMVGSVPLATLMPLMEITSTSTNTTNVTKNARNVANAAQKSGPRLKWLKVVTIKAVSVNPIAIQYKMKLARNKRSILCISPIICCTLSA